MIKQYNPSFSKIIMLMILIHLNNDININSNKKRGLTFNFIKYKGIF